MDLCAVYAERHWEVEPMLDAEKSSQIPLYARTFLLMRNWSICASGKWSALVSIGMENRAMHCLRLQEGVEWGLARITFE